MTASLREAAQMALDALGWYADEDDVIEGMEGNEYWVEGRASAVAAIDALRAALAVTEAEPVPQGWKLVPAAPTEEMIQAGCLSQQAKPGHENYAEWFDNHSGGISERIRGYVRKDFCAMLAAAPQPAPMECKPLTPLQANALPVWNGFIGLCFEQRERIVRAIEQAHGIKAAA